jgi:hypothetical protein
VPGFFLRGKQPEQMRAAGMLATDTAATSGAKLPAEAAAAVNP